MDDPRRLTSTDTGSRPLSFDIYEGSIQKYKTEVDENGDAGIVFCGRTGVGSGSIVATFRGERDGWPFPSSVKLGGARDFIKAENWLVPNQSLPILEFTHGEVRYFLEKGEDKVLLKKKNESNVLLMVPAIICTTLLRSKVVEFPA